jgi:hypothetical protein
MGMAANCPQCGYSTTADTHRGGRLGSCPDCGTQLQGWTAGQARGRYQCPVRGGVFTLGLRHGVQLTEPMRLVFQPGWDDDRYEQDPERPGWNRSVRYHRTEPTDREQAYLDRAGGRVFGPGCAISCSFAPPPPGDRWHGRAGVYLVPAPDTDPATWFANERVRYKKCAACPSKVVANDRHRMPEPWTPRRETYWQGSGRRMRQVVIGQGPHPAGSYACDLCDPRQADPEF